MSDLEALLRELNVDASTISPEGTLLAFKTNGSRAIELWRELRKRVNQTQHWPVLLGAEQELTTLEPAEAREEADEILQASAALGAPSWFAERLKQCTDDLGSADAEWPDMDEPRTESFVIPFDLLYGRPHPDLVIALAPTALSYEVPAFLKYGGWNDCPDSHEHVAMLKYWNEKYGAEVVGMSHDVVECTVARPPQTRDAALELAREQYAYCGDIVWQGTESVEALAASLLHAPQWYFWWD